MRRDADVADALREAGIDWRTSKDQAVIELADVRTRAGGAFSVYTPYRNTWLARVRAHDVAEHDVAGLASRLAADAAAPMPTLGMLGFERAALPIAGRTGYPLVDAAMRELEARGTLPIFSPVAQSRRFYPRGADIRRWLPELARVPAALIHTPWQMAAHVQRGARCVIGRDYRAPVVDHAEARRAALARYSAVGSR